MDGRFGRLGGESWDSRSPLRESLDGDTADNRFVGQPYSWEPKIWDPQAPSEQIRPVFYSPSLPDWLTWDDGKLVGTPTHPAEPVNVVAKADVSCDQHPG